MDKVSMISFAASIHKAGGLELRDEVANCRRHEEHGTTGAKA